MEKRTNQAMTLGQLVARSRPEVRITEIRDEDVELSQEDIDQLIRQEKSRRAAKRRLEEYRKLISQEPEIPTMTADEFGKAILKVARSQYGEYTLDAHNQEIFRKLCLYFTGDPRAEQEGLSLGKGLFLVGPVGCGKTSLMRLCWSNPVQSYSVIACSSVSYQFAEEGFEGLRRHFLPRTARHDDVFRHEQIGTCFDDLGTEEMVKNFGNTSNAMKEVIENRYNLIDSGRLTHITTNFNFDMIEESYGPRVRSRIREMFNIIKFDPAAPDRRK